MTEALFMLEGELDFAAAPEVVRALKVHMAASDGDIKIDCSRLTFIDSAGLSILAIAARRLNSEGRLLELVALSALCRRTIEIGGLAELLLPWPPTGAPTA